MAWPEHSLSPATLVSAPAFAGRASFASGMWRVLPDSAHVSRIAVVALESQTAWAGYFAVGEDGRILEALPVRFLVHSICGAWPRMAS
jgi:hypothetical protein